MEQVSYGPLIMSIMLIMSCYIGFFNVRISQHGTSVFVSSEGQVGCEFICDLTLLDTLSENISGGKNDGRAD